MPSKSQKQHDLMLAVSNDEALAEKVGIKQAVAKEFLEKDAEEGLWQEGSLESFDETTLENEEEMKDLMPELSTESSDDDDDDSSDDDDKSGEDDAVSQENRGEKPFRFEDRFTSKAE
jgi:hypothetical protein